MGLIEDKIEERWREGELARMQNSNGAIYRWQLKWMKQDHMRVPTAQTKTAQESRMNG